MERLARLLVPLVALALAGPVAARGEERPNVIVVLTDDQGWGDLSIHGNSDLRTPHLDSLARDGATFERFYVSPVCAPTRAEMLTGRYHPRTGARGVSRGRERLDLDERTIADAFRADGYATAAFGKWHSGTQYPYHPTGRGFDEFYGFCSGHWGHYFDPVLDRDGELVRGEGFCVDDFTERAMAFVEAHREEPFFVHLAYNTPHSPMQVPDRWWREFEEKELSMRPTDEGRADVPHTRAALAMCENVDWNVGRLLAKLDELELADDTIVVFFSDNGPNGHRFNGGMRGIKGSTDEGGVRSPLFVRWPSRIAPGTRVRELSAAIDLLPTLAELAGVGLEGHLPLDGRSLAPLLSGDEVDWPERSVFSHWGGRVSVRTDRYRLDHRGRLYDMEADPGQTVDIAKEERATAERLRAAVDAWRKEVLGVDAPADRPFPVGHPDARSTWLPARDGVPSGGIQRSSRHPNCSFFRNWTSVDDAITWPVDVIEGGRFDVTLYYACPPDDVGAQLELSCGEAGLLWRVPEAHDPPLRGEEEDRVPRTESYVKDFAARHMGTIELEAGPAELILRAIEIPGETALELRLLVLSPAD